VHSTPRTVYGVCMSRNRFEWPVHPGDVLSSEPGVYPIFVVSASEPYFYNSTDKTAEGQRCLVIVAQGFVANVTLYSDNAFITTVRA
jgi:hypothetical protein